MKKEIIIIALIAVLFVLVAGNIVANFTFYREYKEKTDYLEQQSQAGQGKVEGLEAKFDNFRSSIDDVTTQMKTYSDSIKAIQNTVTLSEDERKNLLSKIEEMKKELQDMQKDYSTAVIDIKQTMTALKDDLDMMGNKAREVELGKITVKQDQKEKSSSSKESSKESAQKSSNFQSGNIRKVGSNY